MRNKNRWKALSVETIKAASEGDVVAINKNFKTL